MEETVIGAYQGYVEVRTEGQTNWCLLALIALIPLQNIYLNKLPSLGGGLNFLNLMLLLSFLGSLKITGTSFSSPQTGFVKWILLFYVYSIAVGICNFPEVTGDFLLVLKNVLTPVPLFYIVYKSCDSIETMKKILWATVVPLPYMFYVFYNNLSWMQFSAYDDKLRYNGGTFSAAGLGSNEIAAFYVYYTLIILAFAFNEKRRKHKLLLLAAAGLNLYSIVYALSRGAYLSILLGLSVYAWLVGRFRLLLVGVLLLVGLASLDVGLLPTAVNERFQSIFASETERDESAQKRIVLWDLAMDAFAQSPLTGVGFTDFQKINEYHMDTHNFYVKVLVETGLIGAAVFCAFLTSCFKLALRLYRQAEDGFLKVLATGFIPCLFALLVSNFFGDRFSHYQLISYFFLYLAMVVRGVEWSTREPEQVC